MPNPAAIKPARLQDADRARQIAEPELIGKGEDQDRVDGHEPQGVEQPRQIGRHTTLLRLQSEVQHVRRVKPEQHKQNQHAGNPETPSLPRAGSSIPRQDRRQTEGRASSSWFSLRLTEPMTQVL